jgi:RTX calcium-binding nonapeptide repeat (4 copies)
MLGRSATRAILGAGFVLVTLAAAAPAGAAPVDLTDDGTGKRWRQLTDTVGLAPDQVAQVCPRDGESRCSGSVGGKDLTGWVWATADQVLALLGLYEPAILTAVPPDVAGDAYFGSAFEFLNDMRPTFEATGYNFHTESTAGWTSSNDEAGQPIAGGAGFGWWPVGGGFAVSSSPNATNLHRGVWLWRPSTDDITAPVITSTVSGTLGMNGWYVSDVAVNWGVDDPESAVAQTGCVPATIAADSPGTTLTCRANSSGGTSSKSVTVKRDTIPPTVTCPSPPPRFEIYQLGVWVRAPMTDETSGPANPFAQGTTMANTNAPGTFTQSVTGADRAGNRTTTTCTYEVVIPACNGLTPTIVGTAQNNVINGTGGADVIVGLGGADTVNGLGGSDVICGGDGPDWIYGGDGGDWIDGGASADDLNGGNGDDYLDGGLHNDSLRGDSGRDTCISGEVRTSSCEL